MNTNSVYYSSSWTKEQDKAFENALAIVSENALDRWERIAEMVPGKSVEEIKFHYEILVQDINAIESGLVPLPCYGSSFNDDHTSEKIRGNSSSRGRSTKSGQKRQKGIAWTEEEHRLFLDGLEKYGKGDWRSISRHYVVSRTPTQVASHAQKYFIRLNSSTKEKRRPSIHDITDKGKAIESSNSPKRIKAKTNKGASGRSSSSKRSSSLDVISSEYDISNFVPPTIVQSSIHIPPMINTGLVTPPVNNVVAPPDENVYGIEPLSPNSLFAGLPELTTLL